MKKIIPLIPLLILFGCSLFSFKYTYKTSDRYPIFTATDIKNNPNLGVALLTKEGAHNTYLLEGGVYKFVKNKEKGNFTYKILYKNIGPDIELDGNKIINNSDIILNNYPETRYALVLWADEPKIKNKQEEQSKTIKSEGKEKVVYSKIYTTTLSINAELVLFDLAENKVLAKASKILESSNKYTEEHVENSSNFLSDFSHILHVMNDIFGDDDNKYPAVDKSSVETKFTNYVYAFLKNVNKK